MQLLWVPHKQLDALRTQSRLEFHSSLSSPLLSGLLLLSSPLQSLDLLRSSASHSQFKSIVIWGAWLFPHHTAMVGTLGGGTSIGLSPHPRPLFHSPCGWSLGGLLPPLRPTAGPQAQPPSSPVMTHSLSLALSLPPPLVFPVSSVSVSPSLSLSLSQQSCFCFSSFSLTPSSLCFFSLSVGLFLSTPSSLSLSISLFLSSSFSLSTFSLIQNCAAILLALCGEEKASLSTHTGTQAFHLKFISFSLSFLYSSLPYPPLFSYCTHLLLVTHSEPHFFQEQ